jgi:hypothetical protein
LDLNQYYKILNLQVGASREEVEKAYRDLVAKWKNNNFALNEINEAYQNITQTKTLPSTIEHNNSSQFKLLFFVFGIFAIIIGFLILISLPNSIPTDSSAPAKTVESIPPPKTVESIPPPKTVESIPPPKTGQSIPPAIPLPTENPQERNIRIVKNIVEQYHKTHTYSKPDLFVCVEMATDVWNMVKTKGIKAYLIVGNVEKDVTDIRETNHVWVAAEISPNYWIALETTGGYLVCPDSSTCSSNNPRYSRGWKFNNPRELRDAEDKLKHPCLAGYILGADNKCHLACGGTYCTGNSVCVNGQCRGCNPGYILGTDLQCHPACGGTYCTGNSVCVNGQCRGCNPGYILGTDLRCHLACGGNTYCTGNSVCVDGQCRGVR